MMKYNKQSSANFYDHMEHLVSFCAGPCANIHQLRIWCSFGETSSLLDFSSAVHRTFANIDSIETYLQFA